MKAKSSVLFESQTAVSGWNEFLEQAAKGLPVTRLHDQAPAHEFEGEINGQWPSA